MRIVNFRRGLAAGMALALGACGALDVAPLNAGSIGGAGGMNNPAGGTSYAPGPPAPVSGSTNSYGDVGNARVTPENLQH